MTFLLPDLGDEIRYGLGSDPSASMAAAVDALRRASPVLIGHGTGSFLALSAHRAGPTAIASLVRHGSGMVFVAMELPRLQELQIPPLPIDFDSRCPDMHVAVDASAGITTGISARDRAHTIAALAAPTSLPTDFVRPGHVVPRRASLSPTAAATDADIALMLASLAGMPSPAAAFCALISEEHPAEIATPDEASDIAAARGLAFIDAREIVTSIYRQQRYTGSSPR